MQQALLSCDFLLAPAYCDHRAIEYYVENLTEIMSSLRDLGSTHMLEHNAEDKLRAAGKFPYKDLFEKNLRRSEVQVYSANDVARIVNNILIHATRFSYQEQYIFDLENKSLDPSFVEIEDFRAQELEGLIEWVALCNEMRDGEISILHHCLVNKFLNVEFEATIADTTRSDVKLPYVVQQKIELHSDYKKFLISIPRNSIFEAAFLDDVFKVRFAIYVETLVALKNRDLPIADFRWDDFKISSGLVSSLYKNASGYKQPFFSVCLSTIAGVLSRDPAVEKSIFKKSEKDKSPRTHGNYIAYRAHVTKSGVALRLMYWENENGHIVLANVGSKRELFIHDPK